MGKHDISEQETGADFELLRFLPYLLLQAAEQTGEGFASRYRTSHNISRTQWRILSHLGEAGELTSSQICSSARLHKTEVSRAVARLEARGWLARRIDRTDRRAAPLQLTRTGREVFQDLAEAATAFQAELASRAGPELLDALIEPLKILAELPKQPAANSQKFVAKKQTGTEPGGREPSFGKM
jgi:DNA-binding MarR family transcriptional regulator